MSSWVYTVSSAAGHHYSKCPQPMIRLRAGWGVEGDAHAGITVQHRSRVRQDPTQPNLRQVHLIQGELPDELRAPGFDLSPGDLGENILTRGVNLLALPRGSILQLGIQAVVELTGLRNPCAQIETFRPGLLRAVLRQDVHGALVRRAGVMGMVLVGGEVRPSDPVKVTRPAGPHVPLDRV
ncbi:MOSC domain-containing protein [Deinococcus malanensis]|uniref:MOSC domain-containing protein n=1 Tax=Deinococcus malanensis TaxID=1706855 RepID=A0ABQ2ELJ6_9DEIO|nr:MOSC domain-containing protein [Deinococcus malanensis]GGK15482.1 MOSC domain-containing protein [Deinococcus malanensis]